MNIERDFIGEQFLMTAKQYLLDKIFQGIKIYPALGYYPFDIRMKPIFDFAINYNIPITTHCTVGAVHFKYSLTPSERYHPFLNLSFPEDKPIKYQSNYTHPLNYECLLNPDLLKKLWHDKTGDYQNLKICIAHWGGEDEWHDYIQKPWSDTFFNTEDYPSLDLRNWHTNADEQFRNFSWFSIICDLIRKYPNVYTDISYTLEDASLLPLLKATLETDEKIRSRVLFGTDFFLVSKSISEREFGINVRAFLGNDLFEQISITNAKCFLSTKLNNIPD